MMAPALRRLCALTNPSGWVYSLCSAGAPDFIYSPFDTPKGPDGVIFLSERR